MIVEYSGKDINSDCLLYFYASWSSKCNLHLDALKKIEKNNSDLLIVKINVTKYHILKERYLIKKIPTFIILKNNNIISRLDGYTDQYSLSRWVYNFRS